MALEVEIVERNSVIVVTLTGGTDIGALAPLHDALEVAASEGKIVVLDVRELAYAIPLAGLMDVLGPAATTVKIVARPSAKSSDRHGECYEVYTSVDAAIGAIRSAEGNPWDDLVARYSDLRTRYAQMLNTCRQLLENTDNQANQRGSSNGS